MRVLTPTHALTQAQGRLAWVKDLYGRCSRIQDTHHLGDAQWDYARELTRAATADSAEIANTEAFLVLNEQIYNDAGKERPKHPGSSDHYRKREYLVDRQQGTWTVDTRAQRAVAARHRPCD